MTTPRNNYPGLSWAMSLLGLFTDGELAELVDFETADTIPAPPPDAEPESAPPVPADTWEDVWL